MEYLTKKINRDTMLIRATVGVGALVMGAAVPHHEHHEYVHTLIESALSSVI